MNRYCLISTVWILPPLSCVVVVMLNKWTIPWMLPRQLGSVTQPAERKLKMETKSAYLEVRQNQREQGQK